MNNELKKIEIEIGNGKEKKREGGYGSLSTSARHAR